MESSLGNKVAVIVSYLGVKCSHVSISDVGIPLANCMDTRGIDSREKKIRASSVFEIYVPTY